jgi:pimeloyl-ACP methyl ester carboxylesterase
MWVLLGETAAGPLLGRLAAFSRLFLFDKRGTGMSDPVQGPPSMGERMDDTRAVLDAAGLRRSTLFGIFEGGTLAVLFAHDHPERAEGLILHRTSDRCVGAMSTTTSRRAARSC